MAGLTFDAGALQVVDRRGRNALAILARSAFLGRPRTVPVVALAQAWRDGRRQVELVRFLGTCTVEPDTAELGQRAGELLRRSGTSDAVDALVVVSAARRGDLILTTDPGDLELPAADFPAVRIVAV